MRAPPLINTSLQRGASDSQKKEIPSPHPMGRGLRVRGYCLKIYFLAGPAATPLLRNCIGTLAVGWGHIPLFTRDTVTTCRKWENF
jgi:hypothetical protein